MKWLEIIELRTGSGNRNAIDQYLKRLSLDLKGDPNHPKFRIYENSDVDSDLSIHLFHSTKKSDLQQSPLGYHIASMLRTFGLVSHTIWAERKSDKETNTNSKEDE